MACYRPVTAWKPPDGGAVVFRELKDHREIEIRCGQCIGCRTERRDAWALRCLAESKMHKSNIFATFTYDEEAKPRDGGLHYEDFQLFMKRYRKAYGQPIRFFVAGEYGGQTLRPHWHALLFGVSCDDAVRYNGVYSKRALYSSEKLSAAWGKGVVTFGEVTFASARYCASYIVSKYGEDDPRYTRVDQGTGEVWTVRPEFARMSLKPGLGREWVEKWYKDLYETGHNAVIVDGAKVRIPRYYDEVMREMRPELMETVMFKRMEGIKPEEQTRARLQVKETIAKAKRRVNAERMSHAI